MCLRPSFSHHIEKDRVGSLSHGKSLYNSIVKLKWLFTEFTAYKTSALVISSRLLFSFISFSLISSTILNLFLDYINLSPWFSLRWSPLPSSTYNPLNNSTMPLFFRILSYDSFHSCTTNRATAIVRRAPMGPPPASKRKCKMAERRK